MSNEVRWGFAVATYFWQKAAPQEKQWSFFQCSHHFLFSLRLYINYQKEENKTKKKKIGKEGPE